MCCSLSFWLPGIALLVFLILLVIPLALFLTSFEVLRELWWHFFSVFSGLLVCPHLMNSSSGEADISPSLAFPVLHTFSLFIFLYFAEVIIDEVSLTCWYTSLCLYISLANLQKAFYQTISTTSLFSGQRNLREIPTAISPIQATLLSRLCDVIEHKSLTYDLDSCQLTLATLAPKICEHLHNA